MQLLWANLWLEEGWRRSGQASLKLHTVDTCQISEDFQKHVLHKLLCVIGKLAILYICMQTLKDGYGVIQADSPRHYI